MQRLEVSGVVRLIYRSLGVEGLISNLLKVKILAACFSYSDPSTGQKWNIILVHSVIVHTMGWLNVAETCCQNF